MTDVLPASSSDSSPPSHRRSPLLILLHFIHDRNPFYLLSALCMFVGFRVILGALDSHPGDWKTLLGLIITLNFYEVVMITLALFLIVKRGLRRDGWILLGVEALFMLDLTNLNAELFTAMPRLGSVVNGICFVLALAKIFIILRTLKLKITPCTTIYIAAQLAFLLGMPGMFRLMRSPMSTISPMQIYGVWWIAAALIAAGAFLVKRHPANRQNPMAALPWRLYVLMPLISLLVHLSSENRVFWVHFHYANFAPVVLAMVVVLSQSRWRFHRTALQGSLGLVAFAVLLSIVPFGYQHELVGRMFGVIVSPLRLILIASWAVTLWLAIRHRSAIAVTGCAGCLALAGMGTDVMQIDANALAVLRWAYHTTKRLIPQGPAQWGMLAIISAFLLLGVGAVVSLKAAPPERETEPVG